MATDMLKQVRPAVVALLVLTVITGLIYPAVVSAIAQVAFPSQANGSLITAGGKVAGSALIGQPFDDPKYFWGPISATSPYAYNAANSSGSNLGPTNPALIDEVKARVDALKSADPGNIQPIPVDLVTSSGSGLDPDISPAAALYQVSRVAKTRGMDPARVTALVNQYTTDRQLGILGEPVVNVLELNLALDAAR
jgi:K+-transporting ATPase ATPase C chain